MSHLSDDIGWRVVQLAIFIAAVLPAAGLGQPTRLDPPAAQARNLGLEEGNLGEVPSGWTLPEFSQKAGYEALLTEEQPHAGKRCVLLRGKDDVAAGTIMQTIVATRYRGKRVRFLAHVRAGSLGEWGQALLWLRVERPAGIGFIDNMLDRPIESTEWKPYEIVADVDDDAESISFGFLLRNGGSAWLDSASLNVVPGIRVVNEPPRNIMLRGTENVTAFAKLYGYVRYFHPSDESAGVNWNQFVVDNVRRIEKAHDSGELARMLQQMFHQSRRRSAFLSMVMNRTFHPSFCHPSQTS